jgi:hypothetical protein
MSEYQPVDTCVCTARRACARSRRVAPRVARLSAGVLFVACSAVAQNVVTQHNDIARSGANNSETILTLSNVNTNTFGKLFSQFVDGQIYAQPLYLAGVPVPGKGTHNIVFVATENDSVYAFDADNNGGANASPLWQITMLDAVHGAAPGATTVPNGDVSSMDIQPVIGITGTPVIDPLTNTLYLVGKTKESGTYVQRLHALDVTTGSEKFAGPVALSGRVAGNGNGSSGGMLDWDPKWENNRAGLLLLDGILYAAFGAHGDNGPFHGWILAYNASTLKQTGVWCATANGIGAGIWMSGAGLSADTGNPTGSSPGGRIFISTGNGTYDASKPYTNSMDYGDSLVRLELTNGVMKVADAFTPLNQSALSSPDRDVASGGVLLLPDQSAGGHTHLLVEVGKEGRIYVVDRDNMGGFSSTSDNIVEEIPVNNAGQTNQNFQTGALFGMPAYGHNTVYLWGNADNLKSFPLSNGTISATPSNRGSQYAAFPGPTPATSSNLGGNPIVWTVETDNYNAGGSAQLQAYDATNITNTLYNSSTNPTRDATGPAVKFVVPTVAHGKVYVGTANAVSVYGLLNGAQQAATPSISPATETFAGTLAANITDSTPNASIFYSRTGTATTNSTPYTGPITVRTTETISSIASAPGFLPSLPISETYTLQTQSPMPTFSVAPGSYATARTVTISDASPNPTIYYAINGNASTSSKGFPGSARVTVGSSETINAIATSPTLGTSAQARATYTIGSGTSINFGSGFGTSGNGLQFNGHTKLNGTRLQLTDTSAGKETASAFSTTPVNVEAFSNDFLFQLSNPVADGFTFTIQNAGLTALGLSGGGLGYGPDAAGGTPGIAKSVAVKFDLYDNAGEGTNSTGLYSNGASPMLPATAFGGGVNLHSGDIFHVVMNYNGTTLTMTVTDTANIGQAFTTSWPIDIPGTVGGNTAYVGFTAGTGGLTATQEIVTWTYASSTKPKTPVTYQTRNLTAVSSGPAFRQIAWAGFPDGTGTILDAIAGGDSVTLTVNVATAGIQDVKVSVKDFNTRGIWQLTINGTNAGVWQDEYQTTTSGAFVVFDLGTFNFASAGNYAFKFTVTGKNTASSGYSIAFDDITLTPQ